MYLKEIRSQGFKSFADKIKIELNTGITGIVGPNGSGKSNIVDAVRWVLGEQSVKSLRGDGAMTDVIFSGSKSRNAQNVASVTLVFDNTDKYLPIDFTEVSIKRRVYRDGTNEYYLNNEKCRLKDITDILMDSGIAKESFNIISQGKIEEILSSKPENRRIIFEEAAGVLKYKKRKEEALRKLERTHDNMNRVNDIINELEVQVEPLKEQKNKAIKYQSISEELEGIEIAVIAKDIDTINEKYQTNKKQIEELNNEIIGLLTNNSSNEVALEEYKTTLNNIDHEIGTLSTKQLELTKQVEQINAQKQIIIERKKYEVEDSKLHNNILNLKEQQLKINNEIASLKQQLIIKENDSNLLKINTDKLEKNINDVKLNKTMLENSLKDKLREQNYLQNRIDNLKDSIENNGTLPASVKQVLNNPKLIGIHDVIGNLIEVQELYSNAISVALGPVSNYIVVDNETSAKEAIRYLKDYNLGRATFFPLSVIKPRAIDPETLKQVKQIKGFIGIASDLTKYDIKYNNIIQNQLGNTLIVDTLDNANIIGRIIKNHYKIVTLDGELLHVGGAVTGGNSAKTRNIISEKYELEKVIRELDNNISKIKDIENKININDDKLMGIEDERYLNSKDTINALEELRIKNKELSDLKNNLDLINKEISGTDNIIKNTLSEEEETILKQYYDTLKELESIKIDLEVVNKQKANINETIEQSEFSLRKENSIVNSKNKELKELEIDVNRMDVKLDTLLNNLSETYNITFEKAINDYHLEIDENIARNKVTILKKELKELGMVNLGAIAEYDRVSERYEFLIKQKGDLDNAEATLLEIINQMDQIMIKEFMKTYKLIETNFKETFIELFKGGNAELKLTDPNNILETGIDIIASPPGKKLTSISLLSGGEKTFTAISLLFAILKSRPMPFCILDEVEAALDEVNVSSFGDYLTNLKQKTQFILITHKKKTMEYVDVLYGITMQESGVSKLVSVKLEEIK